MENEKYDLKKIDEYNEEKPARRTGWVKKFFRNVLDFFKTAVFIIALAFAIRVFLIQPFVVEGQSMEPSFHSNDYLITEKISFRIRPPQRGEIVILHPPENPNINYIKRIVGLPGDIIQIRDGSVYVNNKKINEPYLTSDEQTLASKKDGYTVTLKESEYFVMGDNRNHSRDSREIGPVPKENIVSRIWFRLLPINQIKAFAAVKYEAPQ